MHTILQKKRSNVPRKLRFGEISKFMCKLIISLNMIIITIFEEKHSHVDFIFLLWIEDRKFVINADFDIETAKHFRRGKT